ncbi:MAG: dUTP diphosphatase [Treponema sp.]|nr:dUTP diphosphatase [Treponema sp.]
MKVKVKIVKSHNRVEIPRYESENASGMDLKAFLDTPVSIPPLGRVKIPTGIKIEFQKGYEAQIRPRSGLALKTGLTVLNSPGTIDADYRGDIEIILINLGDQDITINDGDRIAQLVFAPICRAQIIIADKLSQSIRGSGGFGSTGI